MKTDTFTAAPKLDEISFDNPFNVDDVQIYFCHHVLRLVVFGMTYQAVEGVAIAQGPIASRGFYGSFLIL